MKLERVKKEALLTEIEISDVIKRNTRGLENDKRICELTKAEKAIAQAQLDKFLNTNLGNISIGELIEDYLEEPVIDEEQELADRRHNASDDTIG